MATWQQQLETSELIFKRMAATEGMLEQAITEWRETLKNALSAGMMKETHNKIIKSLDPAGLDIRQCINDIKGADKPYTEKIIKKIATLGQLNVSNTQKLWQDAYDRGQDKTKNEVSRVTGGYGAWNNFNVQIQILEDIRKTIESIQSHVTIIKGQYSRFEFDIRQMDFMKEYVIVISTKSIQPRITTFANIHSKLEEPRKKIVDTQLLLRSAANL